MLFAKAGGMKTIPPAMKRKLLHLPWVALPLIAAPLIVPSLLAQEAENEAAQAAEQARQQTENAAERTKQSAERAAEQAKQRAEKAAAKARERAADEARDAPEEASEAAERAKQRAERNAEQARERAADEARDAPEEASEAAERAKQRAERNAEQARERAADEARDAPEEASQAAERAKQRAERTAEQMRERAADEARDAPEEASQAAERAKQRAERAARRDQDMPDESGRQGGRDRDRDERIDPGNDIEEDEGRERMADERRERDLELSDADLNRVTERVEKRIDRRKLEIRDQDEAQDIIRNVLGRESEVSRAEDAWDRRYGARRDRDFEREVDRDEVRRAADFLRSRFQGRADLGEAPEFFRRVRVDEGRRWERRDGDVAWREVRRGAPLTSYEPRYFHNGRRYVHFDSRAAIPAVLLASAALNRVNVQPATTVERHFFRDVNREVTYANPLPPETYRGENAVVVSYPVNKESMITSNDIIFQQGTTRFADSHSYEMVMALANAMKDPELDDARFVIEGHASAEGAYDENMRLSQRRAEAIVRDLVRQGIDPERLVPVGYGESEARYPEDAPERLRSQDRTVMVFRMDENS
jgi:outer membrane protein OmpA-like peptidoglycan-associated protein